MDKEKRQEIEEALAEFVLRVSKNEAASDKELDILPEVAKLLLD